MSRFAVMGHNNPPPLNFEARAVVLIRDGATGRPRFDLPMREYPEWAQEGFRQMMTPEEIEEYFA